MYIVMIVLCNDIWKIKNHIFYSPLFYRCKCGEVCGEMPTEKECLCCQEIPEVQAKIDKAAMDQRPNCITKLPGFEAVVLDENVLQTAYFHYRSYYGNGEGKTNEE